MLDLRMGDKVAILRDGKWQNAEVVEMGLRTLIVRLGKFTTMDLDLTWPEDLARIGPPF